MWQSFSDPTRNWEIHVKEQQMAVKEKAEVVADLAPVPAVVEKWFVGYGLAVFALFSL